MPPTVLHQVLEPALPPVPLLAADLERVLLNLFTNALYALAARARLAGPGYRPELRVSTRQTGATVEVKVRDNGTGMPPAVRARVFEPFFTTKPLGEGTGLGLSLAHDSITKGHGGSIQVASKEGEFTEFILVLKVNG